MDQIIEFHPLNGTTETYCQMSLPVDRIVPSNDMREFTRNLVQAGLSSNQNEVPEFRVYISNAYLLINLHLFIATLVRAISESGGCYVNVYLYTSNVHADVYYNLLQAYNPVEDEALINYIQIHLVDLHDPDTDIPDVPRNETYHVSGEWPMKISSLIENLTVDPDTEAYKVVLAPDMVEDIESLVDFYFMVKNIDRRATRCKLEVIYSIGTLPYEDIFREIVESFIALDNWYGVFLSNYKGKLSSVLRGCKNIHCVWIIRDLPHAGKNDSFTNEIACIANKNKGIRHLHLSYDLWFKENDTREEDPIIPLTPGFINHVVYESGLECFLLQVGSSRWRKTQTEPNPELRYPYIPKVCGPLKVALHDIANRKVDGRKMNIRFDIPEYMVHPDFWNRFPKGHVQHSYSIQPLELYEAYRKCQESLGMPPGGRNFMTLDHWNKVSCPTYK